ncbi:iron-sulfur cluster assembly scaffold protein [Mycoplasma sp. Pen4]|uniref:iron-sulfur cluster assembly scaffold protein n=1 Tax=Mycoplasma sp. Pen4 TaxID=640330 RepID=UPI0016541807|nr:iron-sulfur cluster assembly scaffold protein [Mycoplasma sp. Pen4]QNM93901.1 iron-sulfur cluster assembly scaffold protein [Mycoplasma sp. Pen4]
MHFNRDVSRELIMNHYTKPTHKVDLGAIEKTFYSDVCSDDLKLNLNYIDGIYQNPEFDGHGCAVFIASTDILLQEINQKSKDEAINLINLFERFVNQDSTLTDDEIASLGDLQAFYNVKTHLNRVACALLATNAIKNN